MLKLAVVLFTFQGCLANIQDEHEVTSLPGLDWQINFRHYAGRLNVSKTRSLSYWFVESQNDVNNDPLILWLNGGPGCSSFFGFLQEHGPFMIDDGLDVEPKLKENPNSWNKFANVLYLEAPAGVGFSQNDELYKTFYNDSFTAADNARFLSVFLDAYPGLKGLDFYISGESYAGCYVPTLANEVLRQNDQINLKLQGVVIGNGVNTDHFASLGIVAFPFHGAQKTVYELGKWMREHCPSGFDNFCEGGKPSERPKTLRQQYADMMKNPYQRQINAYDINRPCFNTSLCSGNTLRTYLNKREVQQALHFVTKGQETVEWEECWENFPYHTCTDITPEIKNLQEKRIKILYFYGETDTVCPFIIGDLFVHKIGKNPITAPWFFDDVYAGTKTTFDGDLIYTTIADCGHMAAGWKPKQTARAVRYFINGLIDWNE